MPGHDGLRIEHIMSKRVFTLPEDCSIEEASWALSSRGFGGAPVRDTRGRLVGVVTRADLADPDRPSGDLHRVTVGEVMTPAILALEPQQPAMEAVRLMSTHGVHRIVVLDQRGKLAGIVTSTDCLRALAHGEQFEAEEAAPADAPSPRH